MVDSRLILYGGVPVKNQLYDIPDSDHTLYPLTPAQAIEGLQPICPYDASGPTRDGNTAPTNPDGSIDGNDHHILAVDRATCRVYELWRGSYCNGQWTAANSAVWDLTIDQKRPYGITSVDASGLSVFAGLVKYEEATTQTCPQQLNGVTVQTLCHAIRFTAARWFKGADSTGQYDCFFVAPATHCAKTDASSYNYAGQRIRMKPSVDTSSLPPEIQVITNTMKTYGMIDGDLGSNLYAQFTADTRWSDNHLDLLKQFKGSDFEVTTMPTAYTSNTAPTGPAPTISTPTVSPSVVVQGSPVTLSRAASVNSSYEFFDNGPTIRSADASVTATPAHSTCYTLTARNQFGTTVSTPACVTVLEPPFKGVDARLK